MGTGKTLQTISFLAWIHTNIHKADDPNTDRPSLIIMPKPVLHNWKVEFERFVLFSFLLITLPLTLVYS
jgi:ATP-dependent DNA helicase